jgi:CRP-like cAMP-binding protein/membrane protease YdiL (CAAX protease family)
VSIQSFDNLRNHDFFDAMSAEEWQFLCDHFEPVSFAAGEFLIRENSSDSDLYFVIEGGAELHKAVGGADDVMIGNVDAGTVLGELSFLDDSPRSVSVIAKDTCSIIILHKKAFEEDTPIAGKVRAHIIENIAKLGSKRLKNTNQDYVDSLTREVDLLSEQVNFGYLFIIMILLFGLNNIILGLVQTQFSAYYYFDGGNYNYLYERTIAWAGFIAFSLPVIYLINKIHFPIWEVLNMRPNWKRSLSEGLLISAVVCVPIVLAIVGVITIPGIKSIEKEFTALHLLYVMTPDYLAHSFIQELVARGIMQNAIQKLLRDEKGFKTVMVTAFAFAIMHAHLGVAMAIGTGVGSIVFGFLYLRHKNLLGVTLVHYFLGGFAMRLVRFVGTM